MLQRTKGSVLLLMLVVTGLASQVTQPTLNNKERRLLTAQLKDSKTTLINSLKTLSPEQLNYRSNVYHASISQQLQQLFQLEEMAWHQAVQNMQNGKKDIELHGQRRTDSAILADTAYYTLPSNIFKTLLPEEGIKQLKDHRKKLVLFTNTVTGDTRAHVIKTPAGEMDVYQTLMMIAVQTKNLTHRIEAIKKEKGFPKS